MPSLKELVADCLVKSTKINDLSKDMVEYLIFELASKKNIVAHFEGTPIQNAHRDTVLRGLKSSIEALRVLRDTFEDDI